MGAPVTLQCRSFGSKDVLEQLEDCDNKRIELSFDLHIHKLSEFKLIKRMAVKFAGQCFNHARASRPLVKSFKCQQE